MSDLSLFDASGLTQTVERARALLDDGDVTAARILAAGAYDQAKAAAQFATRIGAAERLVGKARRLQGEALLIEARAKVRMAAEYDAAQETGQALKGRPKSIPDGNTFTLAEAGLTAKDIHEARKLAAAERGSPGIVERAIEARLLAGLEPSRASLRVSIGTASATAAERGNNLYETPIEAMRTLLALEAFSPLVLEPACGRGAIVRPLEDAGYDVALSDLVDYETATKDGELQAVVDFLTTPPAKGQPDIVTNPPYGGALNAFVAHALRMHRPRKMALLLNLNFLCGFDDADRCFAMDENPPSRVLVFTRRLPMMHRDGWDGPQASSSMNTAWFIWEQDADGGYGGRCEVRRVDWKQYQDKPALEPVETESQAKASEDNGSITGGAGAVAGEASRLGAGRTASATSEHGRDSLERQAPNSTSNGRPEGSERLQVHREPKNAAEPDAGQPECEEVGIERLIETGVTGGESAASHSRLTWTPEKGRILATYGDAEVGAVFPRRGNSAWLFWFGRPAGPRRYAATVEACKAEIEALFAARMPSREYDAAADAVGSYYAAIEAKRQRGDTHWTERPAP